MERRNYQKVDNLSECVSCKHGAKCPYTTESDLWHELLESSCEASKLHEKAGKLMERIEKDIRKRGRVTIGFDVDYRVLNCEKFEEEEEAFSEN